MAKTTKTQRDLKLDAYKATQPRNFQMSYTGSQTHQDKRRKADKRETRRLLRGDA